MIRRILLLAALLASGCSPGPALDCALPLPLILQRQSVAAMTPDDRRKVLTLNEAHEAACGGHR